MKYRKLPVVIEATQWFKDGDHPAVFVHPNDGSQVWVAGQSYIETLEGRRLVLEGDWIITGVRGEHYLCKPYIFAKTYEPESSPARTADAGEASVHNDHPMRHWDNSCPACNPEVTQPVIAPVADKLDAMFALADDNHRILVELLRAAPTAQPGEGEGS